jgi:nitrogen fixation protein NifB
MNYENHPCFNDKTRHKYGRIHLPVAPDCNIQCNYCNRLYDCVNESRPGVTSNILTPEQAMLYLDGIMNKRHDIAVAGIAGPGDPFANAEKTMKTFELIREKYPEMLLCVATNGLNIIPYINRLSEMNLSHVTVTINAMDPEIGARIYSWVRYGTKIYRGTEGAKLLADKQIESIILLKEKGILVKVNTIIVPGINDGHIIEVAKKVKLAGADILNCIQLYPNKSTAFENIMAPDAKIVAKIRLEAQNYLPQMNHCTRCRADATGLIDEQMSEEYFNLLEDCKNPKYKPSEERPYIAVTSMEGLLINQHLGEAFKVWIYGNKSNRPVFKECRIVPMPGSGDERWEKFAGIIDDCSTIIVNGAGENPQKIFSSKGINLIITQGLIEETLESYYKGANIALKKSGCGKGIDCAGTGQGCG